MEGIHFEGTGFNTDWISSYTSLQQFISDFPESVFANDVNRENKIKELFELVNGKKKK
jgi:hypothetical protein